ncbi:resolvase, partial [Enterobacter hormaechei]|nr:resolvase [Enterobacter hormaechei]
RKRSPGVSDVEAQTVNAHDLLKMQGLVLHSFIDELIEPEKFAQHIKDKQEVSILNPTFITELEDGVGKAEGDGMAIMVDGNKNKSYATVNGIKYEINSLEDLEKLSR